MSDIRPCLHCGDPCEHTGGLTPYCDTYCEAASGAAEGVSIETDEQVQYYAGLARTIGLNSPDCLTQAQRFEPLELAIEEASR